MQQRRIMSTASPASLWRLRVAYLILKSSIAVLDAFQERAKLLMPVAGRRDAFSMALASFKAQIHLLNLMAAAARADCCFRQSDPSIGEVELFMPATHERTGHRRAVRTRVCQHS